MTRSLAAAVVVAVVGGVSWLFDSHLSFLAISYK